MKLFTRIVSLFLVPCLLADPVFVIASNIPLAPLGERVKGEGAELTFLKQAVSPPSELGPVQPLQNPEIKAESYVAAEAQRGVPAASAKAESAPGAGPAGIVSPNKLRR